MQNPCRCICGPSSADLSEVGRIVERLELPFAVFVNTIKRFTAVAGQYRGNEEIVWRF